MLLNVGRVPRLSKRQQDVAERRASPASVIKKSITDLIFQQQSLQFFAAVKYGVSNLRALRVKRIAVTGEGGFFFFQFFE